MKPRKHLVIPDCQIRPGVPTQHIGWISQYAIDKKPDVIVIIGDWADMASLSSYDKGKKSFEGRTYLADIKAANDALELLMGPIHEETARLFRNKHKSWNPRLIVTLGNHEYRINRAIEEQRELDALVSTDHIRFKEHGFEVYPFLQPVVVDGIAYCHYFSSGVMGRPITTARALLTKLHQSCFAGHQQGRDIAYAKKADGSNLTAIIAGSCYLHDEDYLNAQTNKVWRGVLMLHEVQNGSFDEMQVSLNFLEEKYGSKDKAGLDSSLPLPLPLGAE